MSKILVVIDMQNDFISGSLGTKEAEEIVDKVVRKIGQYPPDRIYATRDTHKSNYLQTAEGKYLPVEHCIEGTKGWQIHSLVAEAMPDAVVIDKPVFGSAKLVEALAVEREKGELEVELVGLCTDICVVTNCLLIKTYLPDVMVKVDSSCCAGVTPFGHEAALLTMKTCQVEVSQ